MFHAQFQLDLHSFDQNILSFGNTGAPNENIVQNHLNIALLNVF